MPTLTEARELLEATDHFESVEVPLKVIEIGAGLNDQHDPEVQMTIEGTSSALSEKAVRQLAASFEIPAPYLLKCPPPLQAANLDHWQKQLSDRKRARVVISDGQIQAVTSPNFVPTPNARLFDTLVERIGNGNDELVQLDYFDHSWDATRFALCHARASHEVQNSYFRGANPDSEVGDVVRAGVSLVNSLVNDTHLEVEPFVFRLVCTNGMVAPDPTGRDRIRYLGGEKSGAPTEWLSTAIDQIGATFEPLFRELDRAAQTPVENVEQALSAELHARRRRRGLRGGAHAYGMGRRQRPDPRSSQYRQRHLQPRTAGPAARRLLRHAPHLRLLPPPLRLMGHDFMPGTGDAYEPAVVPGPAEVARAQTSSTTTKQLIRDFSDLVAQRIRVVGNNFAPSDIGAVMQAAAEELLERE
jgi:hypothetical protein